jgi:hypothetical protein
MGASSQFGRRALASEPVDCWRSSWGMPARRQFWKAFARSHSITTTTIAPTINHCSLAMHPPFGRPQFLLYTGYSELYPWPLTTQSFRAQCSAADRLAAPRRVCRDCGRACSAAISLLDVVLNFAATLVVETYFLTLSAALGAFTARLGEKMTSFRIGTVAALGVLALSTTVVPATSQQVECAQVDNAPQVCSLTMQQIGDLKKLVDQFDNENRRNSPSILNGVVPKVAVANCVRVDNFKPTCGLTVAQLSKVRAQIVAYQSRAPQ